MHAHHLQAGEPGAAAGSPPVPPQQSLENAPMSVAFPIWVERAACMRESTPTRFVVCDQMCRRAGGEETLRFWAQSAAHAPPFQLKKWRAQREEIFHFWAQKVAHAPLVSSKVAPGPLCFEEKSWTYARANACSRVEFRRHV